MYSENGDMEKAIGCHLLGNPMVRFHGYCSNTGATCKAMHLKVLLILMFYRLGRNSTLSLSFVIFTHRGHYRGLFSQKSQGSRNLECMAAQEIIAVKEISTYRQVKVDSQSHIICLTNNLHLYSYLCSLKAFSYVIRNTQQLSSSYRLLNDVISLMIASLTQRQSYFKQPLPMAIQ